MGSALVAWPLTGEAQFSPGKLSRAHEAIAGPTECFKCHEPRKATTPDRCLACHRELGARIAAGRGYHGRLAPGERAACGTCHAEHAGPDAPLVRWPGGKRDSFDHDQAGFALSGAHARLRCDACHRADRVRDEAVRSSKSLQQDRTHLGLSSRCAECHTDPHRGQFDARVAKDDCAACHGVLRWKPATFDHATARFPLAGRHQALACDRCHKPEDAAGQPAPAGTKDAGIRYRPLAIECAACHTDPHRDQLGRDCARCHGVESWQRITAGSFDHARTRYPLSGRHATVDCQRCHRVDPKSGRPAPAEAANAVLRYKPLEFAACTSCHADPHQKRLGVDCQRCHTTAGWERLVAGAFDHARTRYPLGGRHARVACEKCHPGGDVSKPLAFDRCMACHADAHKGQLAQRADRGACESCHDVEGFTPARFGAVEHAATRFALEGAHRAVACPACHRAKDAAAGSRLRFEDRSCTACHADVHAGQFGKTDCTRCHATRTWRLPDFDHASTKFPLDGAHQRTACRSCHRTETAAGRQIVRYKPLDKACRSCHAAPVGPLTPGGRG